MKKHLLILSVAVTALFLSSCQNDEFLPSSFKPILNIEQATDIARDQAMLHGNVDMNGNYVKLDFAFRFGTDKSMKDTIASIVQGDECYILVTSLKPGTLYYYCLEGDNGRVVTRSDTATFVTLPNDRPQVGKIEALSRGPKSIIAGFDVTDDGGEAVTEAGCYVSKTANDNQRRVLAEPAASSEGKYQVRVYGLEGNAAYRLRPFAVTGVGETVGDVFEFSTSDAVETDSAGMLGLIIGDDKYDYTSLTVSGPMNGDDILLLRDMMGTDSEGGETKGKLAEIDMTDVRIVEGGSPYVYGWRRTENDKIGHSMFADCKKLTKIKLPDTVIEIGEDAFKDCISLSQIEIPASVTKLTPSEGCSALKDIVVSKSNTHYHSYGGVLYNADMTNLLWFPKAKTGDYVFPASLTSIGDYALQETKITHCTMPENLKEMGKNVFFKSEVEEVVLPDKLKTIPSATFQKCSRLKVVRLGKATEMLTAYVFDGCPLTDLYVTAKYPPVWSEEDFETSGEDIIKNCTLHVPKGSLRFYKSDRTWKQFYKIVGV